MNKDRFRQFEADLLLTLQGRRPLMEVPYYVCLHNPRDEIEILSEFSNLSLRVKSKGFSCEQVNLAQMMIEILSEAGLLSEDILEKEERERESLESDIKRLLLRDMVDRLKDRLEEKGLDHCAILTRYGALWPFIHLSHIFLSIEGNVQSTLVVPYPSDLGVGYPLNERSIGLPDYYRAEVVDLR